MKTTELIGLLGFCLALLTFILTRLERRKKITIDLYCQDLEEVDSNNEFYSENDRIRFERMVVLEVINPGNRSISLDKSSTIIHINGHKIQHNLDWLGKTHFTNPLNSGQNHKFAVFLDSLIGLAKIENPHRGVYSIKAEIKDLDAKRYVTHRKFELLLEVGEIEKI